jgi:K+/H+ antiporter YhaU regulatory subunit KhtT
VEIDELRLHKRTHLVGKTILELQNMSDGHLLVIALQRADGNVLRSGFLEEKLQTGDSVIIIGRVLSLPLALREQVDRQEMS